MRKTTTKKKATKVSKSKSVKKATKVSKSKLIKKVALKKKPLVKSVKKVNKQGLKKQPKNKAPNKKGKELKLNIDSYRDKLLALREEIVAEYRQITENVLTQSAADASGGLSDYSTHMADVASDVFERDFSIGLASNEMEIVREIDLALRKMDEGTFGICEACDKSIPKNRLDALLYVRLCKKCQEKYEEQDCL